MAQRRCLQALTRRAISLLSSPPPPPPLPTIPVPAQLGPTFSHLARNHPHAAVFAPRSHPGALFSRHFSSAPRDGESDDDDDDDEGQEDSGGEEDGDQYEEGEAASGRVKQYTPEEKEAEAAAIGYRVVGPLQPNDRVFKRYEPVFAVVQIGSHQFKVSNGDSIFTERLKFCDVNDKITLNKVLLLGSKTQTIIGRPILPDAVVHAVVEEHALDAKVIIFKKKRRKNYRRTKGHRQELTQLRITDIQGIEKPAKLSRNKPKKAAPVEEEKVAVAA